MVTGVDDQPRPSGRITPASTRSAGSASTASRITTAWSSPRSPAAKGVGDLFVVVEPSGQAHPSVGFGPGRPGAVRPPRRRTGVLVRAGIHGSSLLVSRCQRLFDAPVDDVWASDHFGVVADLADPGQDLVP